MSEHEYLYLVQISSIMIFVYALKHKMYYYNITGFLVVSLHVVLAFIFHLKIFSEEYFHAVHYGLVMLLLLFTVFLSVYRKYERVG